MKNDTVVFDALRFDATTGENIATGKIEIREALTRDGLLADPKPLAYCSHQWIDRNGDVDMDLARQFSYALAL